MAELLSPGVIIQEVPFGPQPIEGVSTSTAGFVGETVRGPSSGSPTLVTSFPDFERKFGGLASGKVLGYALQGFFDNGGRRAYVARVVGSGAVGVPASEGQLNASSVGGNLVSIIGAITSTATPNQYLLTLSSTVGLGFLIDGLTLLDRTTGSIVANLHLTATAVDANTGVVAVTASNVGPAPPNLTGFSGQRYYVRIGDAGTATVLLPLRAKEKGGFSARMATLVDAVLVERTSVTAKISNTEYDLADVSFLRIGQRLQFRTATKQLVAAIADVNYPLKRVTIAPGPTDDYTGGTAHVIAWRFATNFDGSTVETVLTSSVPADIQGELATRSGWIKLSAAATVDPAAVNGFPTFARAQPVVFTPGEDGTVADTDIVGSVVEPRSGLGALEGQDGINIIAAPWKPASSDELKTVANALISQAERLQDRFAIFDSRDQPDVNDVLADRGAFNSQYAAMYHPWIRIRDPLGGGTLDLPSAGHVAGAYARTDNDRGVFKAPANVVLRSVLGFTRDVSTGEQDVLNPQGVNVLRRFDGLGLVIWGARTVTADTLWKYVPVRRLFIFLEQSIVRGTRYAVFEPNAPPLWARIRDSVTNFLTTQWRAGALFGRTAAEAFFVKVDETTTTQDDRDNGRVNIIVGIAPVKPAEFVVFQIGQAPTSVIVAEQS